MPFFHQQGCAAKLAALALFFAGVCAVGESRPVTFPVSGLVTLAPEPVPLSADWDESWFGAAPATVYHHGIARIACILSTASYVAVDSKTGSDSLSRCYSALGVRPQDIEYHYDLNYADPVWGNDQCAFSFASRKIQTVAGLQTLVFVVIRGTPLSANEWISNLDIGEESTDEQAVSLHAGFNRASQQVLTAFYAYLLERHIDMSSACFLITGHSRGAAVANLLGSLLPQNRLFHTDRLYVYTFATPNVTTDTDAGLEKYGYIWNIVNAEDLVPTIPLSRNRWQYRKYGRVRTIINAWSCPAESYSDISGRVNAIYRKFMLRDYQPFGTGPFIPVQLTRLLSQMNKTVDTYNNSAFGLHKKAEWLLPKVFPAGDQTPGESRQTEAAAEAAPSQQDSRLLSWLNAATGGLLDRLSAAALDMHANELYLAHLLALDEDELYSPLGSSELIVSGSFDGAVFDKSGKLLLRILDNHVLYKSISLPAAAFQITPARLVIGLPANEDFTVVLCHASLLPTPAVISLEHYDASGVLQLREEGLRLFLHRGMGYRFLAGKSSLGQLAVEPEKVVGKILRQYIQSADLSQLWNMQLLFEASLNSNKIFSGGIQLGPPAVYGTLLVSHRADAYYDTLQGTLGIGSRQSLWGPLQLELEGLCNFVQDFNMPYAEDGGEDGFYFVPQARLSLSLKPRRKMLFFGALCWDFCIEDFNEAAFSNALRQDTAYSLRLSSAVRAVPVLQAGIRF